LESILQSGRQISSRFAGISGDLRGPELLLAMQKVEGSSPFSRFRKGLHLQVFFVRAVG
jgi:hypothetical protein